MEGLLPCEKEIIIRMDEEDEVWDVYTTSEKWMKIFDEAKWECIKTTSNDDESIFSKEYRGNPGLIKIFQKY